MLLGIEDIRFMSKYLNETREGTYRLKHQDIPGDDLERLRELDDLNVLCYGKHLIEDFESETWSGNNAVRKGNRRIS